MTTVMITVMNASHIGDVCHINNSVKSSANPVVLYDATKLLITLQQFSTVLLPKLHPETWRQGF